MRIEVEPQELITAGEQIGALGTQLGMLSNAMGQVLAGGVASGNDAAGMNFGVTYSRGADGFASGLADAANAFTNVGLMLEATGYNYRNADAASVAGGPGPSGGVSGEPGKTEPGDAPYGPNGATVPPPSSWYLIQPLLNVIPGFGFFAGTAMTWPNGNSALLNVTAAQWRNLSQGLALFEPAMAAAKALAGGQIIPESADINKSLADLGLGVTNLSNLAGTTATAVSDFATGVQETQDAIRRLLDRLSLEGLWDNLTGFLTGEGDDILREIARDVGTVLENFQDQVKGLVGLLGELGVLLGEAASAFQNWIRPVLVEAFGDRNGNVLADAVTFYTDVQVGSVAALLGLVADTVALADPDTWKGMADLALSIAKDPSTIDDVLLGMGKEFIALDQIQGDHPGRGIGAAGVNIASLFVPGGALSKTGTLAKGLSATRGLFRDGLPGSLGRLPGLGGNTPNTPELPDAPAAPDIPEIRSPGVPESVLAPGGVGPGSSGGPAGTTPTAPSSGLGTGNAPTGSSSTGSGPSQSGGGPSTGGAGPGSGSSTGPAPTGGSTSGPSSNGQAPTGGSPSPGGGPSQSQSGPSHVGSGDGPNNSPSTGSGSDAPARSHGAENPSSTSYGGGNSDPDTLRNPDFEDGQAPSGPGQHDGGANPNSPDSSRDASSNSGGDGSFRPGDEGRVYSMSDGSSHQTTFAPEQLGDNQRVADALERHGVSQRELIDLIQRPTDMLSPDERTLINAVRDDLSAPGPDTVMQKVIPPGSFDGANWRPGGAESYLDGIYDADSMRGAVTIADDTAHLNTPKLIHDGLRLDYDNTTFAPHDPGTHIIRFQTDPGSSGSYDVPRHSEMGGSGKYDNWGDPFTGNGFTKAGDDVIPEYGANDITMREGAEMWEVLDDGTQRLAAVLKIDAGGPTWVRQGNPDE